MQGTKLRQAKEGETDEFIEEWKNFNKEAGSDMPHTHFFIALKDEIKVGYTKIKIIGKTAELKELIVKKEFRKQNIGKELLNKAEIFAKEQGCNRIIIKTTDKYDSFNFYKKNGYIIINTLEKHYMNWTWVYMSKVI